MWQAEPLKYTTPTLETLNRSVQQPRPGQALLSDLHSATISGVSTSAQGRDLESTRRNQAFARRRTENAVSRASAVGVWRSIKLHHDLSLQAFPATASLNSFI